jgi:hypothetical protein
MRSTALGLLAVAILATTSFTLPARADLVGKTVDPAEMMTRAGDGSGAQVDSFFGDIGDFFEKGANAVAHTFENGANAVAHSNIGKAIGKAGEQMYHGHVGQGFETLGNGVADSDIGHSAEKFGTQIYHGQVGDAALTAGEAIVDNNKYISRFNLGADIANAAGIHVPRIPKLSSEGELDEAKPED